MEGAILPNYGLAEGEDDFVSKKFTFFLNFVCGRWGLFFFCCLPASLNASSFCPFCSSLSSVQAFFLFLSVFYYLFTYSEKNFKALPWLLLILS